MGGLVSVCIPDDALGVAWDGGVSNWVCVTVLACGGYGQGCGGNCEVAKVPAKGDGVTRSNLVIGRGLKRRLGEDYLSWVSVGTDGNGLSRIWVVTWATCDTDGGT